jgi:hypothetical protein
MKIKETQVIVDGFKTEDPTIANNSYSANMKNLVNKNDSYKRSSIQIEGGVETISRFSKMFKSGGLEVYIT